MNLTPYLIRGLATGGQFALVAIGCTMVYGILKLINFAHGDLFMLSGIMMIYLAASFPTMPMWVTILIMIALTVFVGFAIEKMRLFPAAHRAADVRDDLRHRRQLSAAESGVLRHRRPGQAIPPISPLSARASACSA